jgi:hypothetical protein
MSRLNYQDPATKILARLIIAAALLLVTQILRP